MSQKKRGDKQEKKRVIDFVKCSLEGQEKLIGQSERAIGKTKYISKNCRKRFRILHTSNLDIKDPYFRF